MCNECCIDCIFMGQSNNVEGKKWCEGWIFVQLWDHRSVKKKKKCRWVKHGKKCQFENLKKIGLHKPNWLLNDKALLYTVTIGWFTRPIVHDFLRLTNKVNQQPWMKCQLFYFQKWKVSMQCHLLGLPVSALWGSCRHISLVPPSERVYLFIFINVLFWKISRCFLLLLKTRISIYQNLNKCCNGKHLVLVLSIHCINFDTFCSFSAFLTWTNFYCTNMMNSSESLSRKASSSQNFTQLV